MYIDEGFGSILNLQDVPLNTLLNINLILILKDDLKILEHELFC